MSDTARPRLSRAERFSAGAPPEVHARAAGAALTRGFSHYALGVLGRNGPAGTPNIELFDEPTGSRLALNDLSLRPVRRRSWNRKNLTAYIPAMTV